MSPSPRDILIMAALFGGALAFRLVAASGIEMAPTEPSAYYVGVARNLLEGRGLVSDAAWSYLAPHDSFPVPAFAMWLPLASFLAMIPMALLGPTFAAAQLSSVVLGALVAPLAWVVGREAATGAKLSPERGAWVALGGGLVAAVLGPLVVADMAPESTTAFTVFGVLSAVLAAWTLRRSREDADAARPGRRGAGSLVPAVLLGVALGLAWLARQEATWLAAGYLAVLALVVPRGRRLATLLPTLIAGAATVTPWLLRNLLVLGSPLPVGTSQLAVMTRNEELFAYTDLPSLGRFLAQGPLAIIGLELGALARNALDVVLIPTAPLGVLALAALMVAVVTARRRVGRIRDFAAGAPGLAVLLLGGGLGYLATSLIFPVASAWGTFRHAAGPLLVALAIVAVLALDAIVAAARDLRSWPRSNAFLAPLAALLVALPLGTLQVGLFQAQATALAGRYDSLRRTLEQMPELAAAPRASDGPAPRAAIVSDHPIWLAETLRRPVLALPDEEPDAVWALARRYEAPLLVVIDRRGRYPDVLLDGSNGCFRLRDDPSSDRSRAHVFAIEAGPCGPVAAR